MAGMPTKDDRDQVSDPTDWLTTPLSGLAGVDSALRCQVCKEFFTTPMMTSCGHTFCSACIRRSLGGDGKCPACRAGDQEIKLKNNAVVEDAVEVFQKVRKATLDFAIKSMEAASTQLLEEKEQTGKRYHEDRQGEDEGPRKRTRSSTRKATYGVEQGSVAGDEDLILEEPTESEPGRRTRDSTMNDGLVPCPICQGRMTEIQIDRHIDQCMGVPPPTRAVQSPLKGALSKPTVSLTETTKAPERLPQIHYGMIKDNALKRKLVDLGLAANGSRAMLERRYTEWVTLVNANRDAKRPRSKREVLKDLDFWERTQGSRAPITNGSAYMVKDKEFDRTAWGSKHDDTFRDLIANAKQKQVQKVTPSMTSEQASSDVLAQESPQGPSQNAHLTSRLRLTAVSSPEMSNTSQTLPSDIDEINREQAFEGSPVRKDGKVINITKDGCPPSSRMSLDPAELENTCTPTNSKLTPLQPRSPITTE